MNYGQGNIHCIALGNEILNRHVALKRQLTLCSYMRVPSGYTPSRQGPAQAVKRNVVCSSKTPNAKHQLSLPNHIIDTAAAHSAALVFARLRLPVHHTDRHRTSLLLLLRLPQQTALETGSVPHQVPDSSSSRHAASASAYPAPTTRRPQRRPTGCSRSDSYPTAGSAAA